MAGKNVISFFKFIFQTNLQTIKIPNKFTRRYGVGLSNPVFLKSPDGRKWKVYCKKGDDHEVWLEKGWKEFAENYSLENGCLVLFKYDDDDDDEGNSSNFDVLILDHNAVEIDYHHHSCDIDTIKDENNSVDQSDDDDESLQILDERRNQKGKGKVKCRERSLPLSASKPHLKLRGKSKAQIENTGQITTSLNLPKDPRALEVAKNFISCNPFFTVCIKPINLVEKRMYVPSLKRVIENKEKYVKLQIKKRSWKVKLLRQYKPNITARRFSSGWSSFASESGLQPGNICVFELINTSNVVFKVHVFK